MKNWIKSIILEVDKWCDYWMICVFISKEYIEEIKAYKKFSIFLKKNKIIIFIIKISFMVIYIYMNYTEAIENKVIFITYIIIMVCLMRLMLKKILYRYGWDGKYPVRRMKRLRIYLKSKDKLSKVLIVIYKYLNIWRIILILRNQFIKRFRYVRYIFFKVEILERWSKIEKKIRYVIERIILEYIRVVIYEIYIPIKRKVFFGDIVKLVEWRFIILILLIVFKSIPFILKYLLIYKAIQVIWDVIIYDFAKKERVRILFSYNVNNMHLLSQFLKKESYILKNLTIKETFGYDELFYLNSRDCFYSNKNWVYNDFYKGFYMKDVENFNNFLMYFSKYFMLFEYALTKEELKENWEIYKENLKEFVIIIERLKEINNLIKESSKLQKMNYEIDVNRAEFSISVNVSNEMNKEMSSKKKINNREYRKRINEKFQELNNYVDYIDKKYGYEREEKNEYDLVCKIFDSRIDRLAFGEYNKNEDEKLYVKVMKKYNLY